MMNFVNTGLDESILKSFDVEHPSEELVKAMNRQGLVQKEVQVKGKNGQTFTRKQWVKATNSVNNSKDNSKDAVKFDKTKSGKVGGIQVGRELAPVVKNAPLGSKKLREVTDGDTGKTYSIYTDTGSNKPDGIVAVENQSKPQSNGSASSQKNNSVKPDTNVSPKLSSAEAKAKTKEVTSKVTDKKAFMEKAKAQGITWKENDHEGINWMRCCMAMNKHFENGGSWEEKAPKSTKSKEKTEANTKDTEMNKQKDEQAKVTNFGGKHKPYSWMSKEENEKLSSIPKYVDKPVEQWGDYSITQGNYHENFESIDELKSALEFRGLPLSLANFDVKKFKADDGYIQNDYQNAGVYAYPEVNPDWDKAYDEASKAARKRRTN